MLENNAVGNTTENDDLENTKILCRHYGVGVTEDVAQNARNLSATQEFKKFFSQTQDVGITLDMMADVKSSDDVDAWYVKSGILKYNEAAKGYTEEAGCRILMPDGRVFNFEDQDIPGASPLQPVKLSGVVSRNHLIRGTAKVSTNAQTRVLSASHPKAPPLTSLTNTYEKTFKTSNRGTIYGNSGDSPFFAVMRVLSDGGVRYFPEGNYGESLKVTAEDSEGFKVHISLDPNKVREMCGLTDASDPEDYEAALAGEILVVNGHMGVTYPQNPSRMGEGVEREFDDMIQQLEANGFVGSYERKKDGREMKFLDLSNDPDGNTCFEFNGLRVMNIEEEENKQTGEFSWKMAVHHEDMNKGPWVSVKSTTWYTADGEERVWNPGAYFDLPTKTGNVKAQSKHFGAINLNDFFTEDGTPAGEDVAAQQPNGMA